MVKKCMAILLAIGLMCLGYSQSVQACTKTPNCYAEATTATCGYVRETTAYGHMVEEPNGYISQCAVTIVSGPHTIKCAGCNAVLYTENGTCSEKHSNVHCFSKYNMCKR